MSKSSLVPIKTAVKVGVPLAALPSVEMLMMLKDLLLGVITNCSVLLVMWMYQWKMRKMAMQNSFLNVALHSPTKPSVPVLELMPAVSTVLDALQLQQDHSHLPLLFRLKLFD